MTSTAPERQSACEFIRWIREWDPACSAVHDWIYSGGAYLEADPYSDEQVATIRKHVDAVRITSGHLGYSRAIEIRVLVSLLDGDFDKRIGADPKPPLAIDRARISSYIRESQANVKLSEGGA